MLLSLRIRQFAIMEDVKADFYCGESVLTGETGSGKSIFVDALDFISGAKSDQRIRRNEENSTVEAVFSLDKNDKALNLCDELEIPTEDGSLLIRRELSDRGSRQWINDKSITLNSLKKIMSLLIDIHAQNAQSILKNQAYYLPLLDAFIGAEAEKIKAELKEFIAKAKSLRKLLEELDLSPEEAARKKDLLEFQKDEIEQADLKNLDEEALDMEYKDLNSALDRYDISSFIIDSLTGERRSIKSEMDSLAARLDDLLKMDDKSSAMNEAFWQILAELDSFIGDLDDYRDRIVVDSDRIEEIDDKFQLLQKLKRKYGDNKDDILNFYQGIVGELENLREIDSKRSHYKKELSKVYEEIKKRADFIHDLRINAAAELEEKVKVQMKDMAIKNIAFKIAFSRNKSISSSGYDNIDFKISTNPGEEMLPLAEVASGGEMSRFMLALKIISCEFTSMPTIVFDEIDTGISGRTAQLVSEKLSDLSRKHQIIVISHLPQIAALADQHYLAKKESLKNITLSKIIQLDQGGRLDELARLIGGVSITSITKSSAAQMLEQADNWKEYERNCHD